MENTVHTCKSYENCDTSFQEVVISEYRITSTFLAVYMELQKHKFCKFLSNSNNPREIDSQSAVFFAVIVGYCTSANALMLGAIFLLCFGISV